MRKYLPLAACIILCIAAIVIAQVRVGPNPTADSLTITPRGDRFGGFVTQAGGGNNKERVRRGACYFASDQGSGVAPGTALGTTAALVVYNPQNSGQLVIIRRVYAEYLSGTLGTGNLYHCYATSATQTAPSAGTLLTNRAALNGNAVSAVAVVRTGATVIQPVAIAPFVYLPPELATSVTAPQVTMEDVDDAFQLLPGTSYQLQAVAAAGTNPLITPAVFWEEQPLLNGQP
jgi:hypothetical protein